MTTTSPFWSCRSPDARAAGTTAWLPVVVPTVVQASAVTIREGEAGSVVWSKGQFRAVAGIAGGAMGADARSVELTAGSGRYAFTVSRD